MLICRRVALALVPWLLWVAAASADNYPDRVVRIVNPFR